ncbi:hypothetical protein OQA88_7599 [Cercophora sp. LCS_1]
MDFGRPLRGGCQCGRNRYIITIPKQTTNPPRVLFGPSNHHHITHVGTPLAAYLRVPLQNYFSTTIPILPDETTSMINRVYQRAHEQRRFCGFCGTPLSYWSEEPRSEADYIQLALGSLFPEDLADLEELGLCPSASDDEEEDQPAGKDEDTHMEDHEAIVLRQGRETVGGVLWFDALTEGSRLGTLRTAKGGHSNRSGTVRVEWEVVEWTADDDAAQAPKNGKRKLADRESGSGIAAMEGIQQ